jgi:SSS family solute:Na+ symporter
MPPNGKFNFWPELNAVAMVAFISGLITMGFGSIPQQDVFQRANASKNESIAVWGTVLGGVAYFLFAAVPLFLAYSANLIDPALAAKWLADDPPEAVAGTGQGPSAPVRPGGVLWRPAVGDHVDRLRHPAGTVGHDLRKRHQGLHHPPPPHARPQAAGHHPLGGGGLLRPGHRSTPCGRWDQETGIHQMVENAYKVTLVLAFVPLVAGLYWKRASTRGAYLAIALGLFTWIPHGNLAAGGQRRCRRSSRAS